MRRTIWLLVFALAALIIGLMLFVPSYEKSGLGVFVGR